MKGRPSNMISCSKVPQDKLVHSCQKPVSLMAYLIENSTVPGETVLDPFLGSGSTAIAAIGNNRKFIGFEIDPKTYEIAIRRMREDAMQLKLF